MIDPLSVYIAARVSILTTVLAPKTCNAEPGDCYSVTTDVTARVVPTTFVPAPLNVCPVDITSLSHLYTR